MPNGIKIGRSISVRNSTASINIDIIFVSIMFSSLTTMPFAIPSIACVKVISVFKVIKKTYDVLSP